MLLAKQLGHGAAVVDAADGTSEEFGDGEDDHIGEAFLIGQGNGVSDDDLSDGSVRETFDSGSREDAVGGTAIDISGTVFFDNAYRLGERTGSVDLIIDDEGVLANDGADDTHGFNVTIVADTAFLDDGEGCIEAVGEMTGLFGEAFIGGNDGEVVQFFLHEETRLNDLRGQFVHGNIEEALDLSSMHIHSEDTMRPGDRQAVSNEASGDRDTGLIFLIGTAIGVVGNDGSDTRGGGAFERVDHDEEFHD